MLSPRTIYENNRRAALAVSDFLKRVPSSPHRFSVRPYNRFDDDFTAWWLIPAEEWPAYRYSKLFVRNYHRDSKHPGWLYTGFYVEQGYGADLSGMPGVSQKHIMDSGWYWYDFLKSAQAGELDTPTKQVLEHSKCPVLVSADAYSFNKPPQLDTERPDSDDSAEWSIDSQDLKFHARHKGTGILAQVGECANLRELAYGLESLEKDFRFYWVNLQIGILLRYCTGTSADGWGAAEIWHNALKPWNPWVK